MRRRKPIPRLWLMTDERMGERLWEALTAVPRGGGVVFRHFGTPGAARAVLFAKVARVARRRGLVLLLAGPRIGPRDARDGRLGAGEGDGLRAMAVHDAREAAAARRRGADLAFVSPVFATRTHPGAPTLGRAGYARLAARLPMPVIAMGGMDAARAARLRPRPHGWAAIDAWLMAHATPRATRAAIARGASGPVR